MLSGYKNSERAMDDVLCRWRGGMLLVQTTGLFGFDAAERLYERVRRETERRSAVKVLIDLRRAVLLFGPEDGGELARLEPALDVAIGFLIDPAHKSVMDRYLEQSVNSGRTRLVFTRLSRQLECWIGGALPEVRPLPRFEPAAPRPPGTPSACT